MSEQYFFRVNGMEDSVCEAKVKEVVSAMKGVEFVDADYESNMLIVRGCASADKIANVINAQGYNAILVAE